MMRIFSFLISLLIPLGVFSQSMSYDTLFIPKRTAFLLPADTLLANQIVMADSSAIILGRQFTVIIVNRLDVGVNCKIIGDGLDGGAAEASQHCTPILKAADGENGKDLMLLPSFYYAKSDMTIFLNGGSGGDGTISILPGSGGDGGNVIFRCSNCEKNKLNTRIKVENNGGNSGRTTLLPTGMDPHQTNSLTSKKGKSEIVDE